ncbi:MAG TPA: 6-hydroxymethylpterin diphosphokinase MptE-like protein [Alphaproteobacteria bacterium]|nr:6-hydroxymethylpterin diphosphokinase MptE-like protein [Alphaproteobacteria bacterium]
MDAIEPGPLEADIVAAGGDPALYRANLAAFEQHAPAVHRMLVQLGPPAARVVGNRDALTLNLDLGHTALYDPDAVTFTRKQIDSFAAKEQRWYMGAPPVPAKCIWLNHRLAKFAYDFAQKAEMGAYDRSQTTGYCVVMGVGLGLHLEPLVRGHRFRDLLVCEQYPDFLRFSLYFADWAFVFEEVERQGGRVMFFMGSDPEFLAIQLFETLRGRCFGLIDGFLIFRHYDSYYLGGAFRQLQAKAVDLVNSRGYFEDELTLLRNGTLNLLRHSARLMVQRPHHQRHSPAFVIGSGPSIDATIDTIARLQDRAVIISCGTGLRKLLKNGVRPDFHCELESTVTSFDVLTQLRQEFDLDGITLLAASTVDPRLPALFGSRILYIRDSLSPTHLWGRNHPCVLATGPTVTNLGVKAAIVLGFEEIYLFGVDLGSRQPDEHHSKDSIYLQGGELAKRLEQWRLPMNIALPGNFGGTVYTNHILHWSRAFMAIVAGKRPDLRFFNCSDGARIDHFTPKLAETLTGAEWPAEKRAAVEGALADIDPMAAGALVSAERLAALRSRAAAWYAALADDIAALPAAYSVVELNDAVTARLAVGAPDEGLPEVLSSVNTGTFLMLLQTVFYYSARLKPEWREAFHAEARAELLAMVGEMGARLDAELAALLAEFPVAA